MGETDVKPERPKQQHLNMLVKHIMSDFESYAINVLIPMFINQVFKYSVGYLAFLLLQCIGLHGK